MKKKMPKSKLDHGKSSVKISRQSEQTQTKKTYRHSEIPSTHNGLFLLNDFSNYFVFKSIIHFQID